MTEFCAFDSAWAIVKMPIVPHSLRQVGDNEFHADFEDPITADVMPMTATTNREPLNPMLVEINHYDPEEARLMDVLARMMLSDDKMTIHTTGEQRKKGQSFWPYHSFVQEPFRRRGYGTAMYDMAAAILDREKGKQLTPSNSQSDNANALWSKNTGRSYPFGAWPVRDDLWRGEP